MIAVTFALPAESSGFIKLLTGRSRDGAIVRGSLHGSDVCVLHTGVGEKTARVRTENFLANDKPQRLVSAGFAGALTRQLQVGDILLAENYSAPEQLAKARRLLPSSHTHIGRLFTARAIVDSAEERAELARRSGALAVDMETCFIAEACSQRAVPMLSVRAISDSPAAPLPLPANVMFDLERQRTPFAALGLYVAKNPAALWRLGRFGRQIQVVRQSLTDALEILLTGA